MSTWEVPPAAPGDYMAHIRALGPEEGKLVENQHVVSKVVLKGFAAPGAKRAGWQLTPFDVRRRKELRSRGLKGCGKISNFLAFASASAERLWDEGVENKLDSAINTARERRLHDDERNVEVVKDGIALHLVWSLRYLSVHQDSVSSAVQSIYVDAPRTRTQLLQAEFQSRHGLHAAGPEALRTVLDEPIAKWLDLDTRGALARVSLEQMFYRVCAALRPHSLEVWHVPAGYELLISDSPAATFQRRSENTIIKPNIAVGGSCGIVLPLARDCMVVIGPNADPKDSELTPNQVRLFNLINFKPWSLMSMLTTDRGVD